jgi:hypothetical protein
VVNPLMPAPTTHTAASAAGSLGSMGANSSRQTEMDSWGFRIIQAHLSRMTGILRINAPAPPSVSRVLSAAVASYGG